jgi:hypothetical protein
MAHTVTPWRVGKTSCIIGGDSNLIAHTERSGLSGALNHTNAHHIVRCVNAHEALVAALEQCERTLSDLPSTKTAGTRTRNAFDAARAALKLAKGE